MHGVCVRAPKTDARRRHLGYGSGVRGATAPVFATNHFEWAAGGTGEREDGAGSTLGLLSCEEAPKVVQKRKGIRERFLHQSTHPTTERVLYEYERGHARGDEKLQV